MSSSDNRKANAAWSGRANNFDALRIALAVVVLASHSVPLTTGSEQGEWISRLTHGQLTGGGVAVDLFFVMSGFMITASMERTRGAAEFLKRRAQRIYPAFIVCAFLSFVIVAPLSEAKLLASVPLRILDFALQTLRLREFTYTNAFPHNAYPGHAINGSAWSVQYEVWCYVGVLFLGLSRLLKKRLFLLLAFLVSIAVSVFWLRHGIILGGEFLGVLLGSPQLWVRVLPYYLAGVVFYLYRDCIPKRITLALASCVLIGVAAALPHGVAMLFPLGGTYLVFYLAYAPWLRLHSAAKYGDFSYGLYLYAFPIQQLIMSRRVGLPTSPATIFLLATPLAFMAAILSWYGVERHFLRPARRHESAVEAIVAA